MNAFEKIEFLRKTKEQQGYGGPYFLDVSYEPSQWRSGEIESIWNQFSWLPPYYIEFLKKYDSLGLAWVRFLGSSAWNINPLHEEIDYWKEKMGEKYFPIGRDSDGSMYVLNRKAEVLWMDKYDYEWENPQVVANSLEEFIGKCLLGNRYPEFNSIENNTFYDWLKLQGWCD